MLCWWMFLAHSSGELYGDDCASSISSTLQGTWHLRLQENAALIEEASTASSMKAAFSCKRTQPLEHAHARATAAHIMTTKLARMAGLIYRQKIRQASRELRCRVALQQVLFEPACNRSKLWVKHRKFG